MRNVHQTFGDRGQKTFTTLFCSLVFELKYLRLDMKQKKNAKIKYVLK